MTYTTRVEENRFKIVKENRFKIVKNNNVTTVITLVYSPSNCKLVYIDSFNSILMVPEENRKEIMDKLMEAVSAKNLLIHITIEPLFNWLKENYTHYYAVKVPIGYSGGFQYHILIKNNVDTRAPIQPGITEEKVIKIVSKAFEKTKLKKERIKIISEELKKESV